MFEAIARLKSAHIRPTKVEICAPLHYHHYTTNYGGPLRKGNQMSKGSSYQLIAIVLNDVCYRIYGVVEEVEKAPTDQTTNHLHYLQDKFRKRLQHGRWFQVPCLGWKEFTPSYVGPLRESTQVEESVDLVIPSMLFSVYGGQGDYCPTYKQQVHIVKGVLRYAE
jgi:CRISPR-associated protein Cas5d